MLRADPSRLMFKTTTVYQNADGSLMSLDGYLVADSREAAEDYNASRLAEWSDAISITLEDDNT